MLQSGRKFVIFAACLAAVAGFVDALGFINMGGVFVSFMSGNSTRLGVGITNGMDFNTLLPGIIITLFVAGVMAGSIIGHYNEHHRASVILSFITGLLFGAALFHANGHSFVATLLMAVAMGAENTIFEKDGEVRIGVTYMTGTLVKAAQRIAALFWGGSTAGWFRYALLWLGLVCGAMAGAVAYQAFGLSSLWFAAGFSLALAISSVFMNFATFHSETEPQ
ncbi:MAG: hypothetical protein JWO78_845 [Micavibrio sp.]|nr:hypothetical protein [Micavibrio sp.]